jgi:hypothetical protein
MVLYACELLVGPQKELERRVISSVVVGGSCESNGGPKVTEDNADAEDGVASDAEGMDVDAVPRGECEEEAPVAENAAAVDEAAVASEAGVVLPIDTETALATSKFLDQLGEFLRGEFFDGLRHRVLKYLTDMQAQQQRELPGGIDRLRQTPAAAMADSESSGDDEGAEESTRRAEIRRRHAEQKWSFPDVPGRRIPPGPVDLEFTKALIQVFELEENMTDQVAALRERMCQKMKVSCFSSDAVFEYPCFPIILRHVPCPWCSRAENVDVTSHLFKGPGLWVCTSCGKFYEKETMEARLVALVENVVQAWQAQEITCQRCRRLKGSRMLNFCECFGRFQTRFKKEDFLLVLRIMRSLVEPHNLEWLGQTLDAYECIR